MTEQALYTRDPELEDILRLSFHYLSGELRVCMPGRIVSYDPGTQLATVEPALQRRDPVDGTPETLAAIPNVPVVHPQTAKAGLLLPVEKDDQVLLVFADRDIGPWRKGSGGPALPENKNQHGLSDAFAVLGGWPAKAPWPPTDPKALELRGTKIVIGNGTEELLTILDELMNYLEADITFSNGGGPTGPPTNAAGLLTPIRNKLKKLKV